MALPIPSLQDVVRLIGPDAETTAANYRLHLEKGAAGWGYGPAKRQARAVFSLTMTRDAAVRACGSGNPLGRTSNEEVGGLIWDLARERGEHVCHPLTPRPLSLRPDIAVKVDPLFFFIENGVATIFYLQPRRGHVPGTYGMRGISTAVLSLFATDDLDGARLLLFDLSCPAGSKDRMARAYSCSDLVPLAPTEAEAFFQKFADAYDILTKEGVKVKERPKRPKKEDPGLFDEDIPPEG